MGLRSYSTAESDEKTVTSQVSAGMTLSFNVKRVVKGFRLGRVHQHPFYVRVCASGPAIDQHRNSCAL